MFGFFRNRAASHLFWDWLAANTQRIQSGLKQNPETATVEIRRAFKNSYPDLTWEVSPSKSGPWLFSISADGNPELFSKVQQVIHNAPTMAGFFHFHFISDATPTRRSLCRRRS